MRDLFRDSNKNRRGKESLALSKKWPKMHFEEEDFGKKSMSTF